MKNIGLLIVIFTSIITHSQSLLDYVNMAKNNNALLKVATNEVALENERMNEVANYENTNFSFGAFALTPETRVGSQLFKVGVSQKLPWFGEFKAKKETVKALTSIKEQEVLLSERNLSYQVKERYYELYKKQQITDIYKENKEILSTYENMALAALSNDRASISDVIRIRVQKNELHSKMFQNINSLEALYKNFNRLLQRDVALAINVVDTLSVLDILFQNKGITSHPSISKIKNKYAVYEAKEQVLALDKRPKISIGLDYILIEKRADVNVLQNGKDVLMPKIALSIPIFNKKYQSQEKQLVIQKERINYELENQTYQLEMALETAVLSVDNAILNVVASQKNKEEIQRAINVDLKAYETGILNYDKILRLQLQKIKYQLMELEAIKTVFISKSRIEYLAN